MTNHISMVSAHKNEMVIPFGWTCNSPIGGYQCTLNMQRSALPPTSYHWQIYSHLIAVHIMPFRFFVHVYSILNNMIYNINKHTPLDGITCVVMMLVCGLIKYLKQLQYF